MVNFSYQHSRPTSDRKNHDFFHGDFELPGAWQLVLHLFETWAANPPVPGSGVVTRGLWLVKNSLTTAGLVRAYRDHKNPGKLNDHADPLKMFLEARGLSRVDGLEALDAVVYQYAATLPYVDSTLKDDEGFIIRQFHVNGVPFFFHLPDRAQGQPLNPAGPFVREADHEALRKGFADLIWAQYPKSMLLLSVRNSLFGEGDFCLSDAGESDDYVSDGADTLWMDVQALAARCRAFQAKGFARKILLYGPPGCGKTSIARSMAQESGRVLAIDSSVIRKASTDNVMSTIMLLRPHVLLLDDMDRYGTGDMERMLHNVEFLGKRQNGITSSGDTIIIGTVNAIDQIDPALLRPGRFDEVQHVTEPLPEHRQAIITHYLRKFKVDLDAVLLTELTDGMSPADIREIVASVASVGVEYLNVEVARVRLQRGLYAGNKVSNYLSHKVDEDDDDDEAAEPPSTLDAFLDRLNR